MLSPTQQTQPKPQFQLQTKSNLNLNQSDSSDPEAAACGGKGFLALLFITGWVMIFAGAAYIGYTSKRSIDSVLAHTFLELERQVEQANKAAQTGPLVGPDYKPLLVDGFELPVAEALRDWTLTVARLKAASKRAGDRAAKLREEAEEEKRREKRTGSM